MVICKQLPTMITVSSDEPLSNCTILQNHRVIVSNISRTRTGYVACATLTLFFLSLLAALLPSNNSLVAKLRKNSTKIINTWSNNSSYERGLTDRQSFHSLVESTWSKLRVIITYKRAHSVMLGWYRPRYGQLRHVWVSTRPPMD